MRYVVVEGCPCPAPLAPFLMEVLRASGATLNSCYRGADVEGLLHRLGKHSQAELYAGWLHDLPGFYPANPPGRSTHELRNDGKAYPGKIGRRLKWWQCGIDISDSHVQRFINEAAKRGWVVSRTYPFSRSEYHHVNFRKPPWHKRIKARWKGRRLKRLSAKGAVFIARFEGFSSKPYNDPSGYATVGYGHLIRLGPVKLSDPRVKPAAALKLLQRDAEVAASVVRSHVRVKITQAQFDALVSFVFNVGGNAFINSTLLKRLNRGDKLVGAEFLRWNKSAGRVLPGLAARRIAERRLFSTGRYT